MEAIKDTLRGVLQILEIKNKKGVAGAPEDTLKKILTKRELRHIKFNYFKAGVLDVSVDSSSWLYQLNLGKESLLAKLSREAPGIKNIRFRLGRVR